MSLVLRDVLPITHVLNGNDWFKGQPKNRIRTYGATYAGIRNGDDPVIENMDVTRTTRSEIPPNWLQAGAGSEPAVPQQGMQLGRYAPYLPELQITNDPVGDLAESPAMRAVGLLVSVPPLRPSVRGQLEIEDGTLKRSPLGREHQPNPSPDRWSRARLR